MRSLTRFGSAGTRAVAIPGNGLMNSANATAAFTAVEALNAQVKSQCVGFGTAAIAALRPQLGWGTAGFQRHSAACPGDAGGQVGALLILGQPNPVFTLPTATRFHRSAGKSAVYRRPDAL